jgi:hypothetical protein
VKDGLLHIRIEKTLREKAVKKAARSKKTLTQYVCDLIAADTQRKARPSHSVPSVDEQDPGAKNNVGARSRQTPRPASG